jgi:hypothetical protein
VGLLSRLEVEVGEHLEVLRDILSGGRQEVPDEHAISTGSEQLGLQVPQVFASTSDADFDLRIHEGMAKSGGVGFFVPRAFRPASLELRSLGTHPTRIRGAHGGHA